MDNEVKQRKPIHFLEDLRRNDVKMEFKEGLGQFLREKWGRQWIVTKIRAKNWKSFKNCLRNAEHAFFAIEVSHQQVARSSYQNTWRQNCEKNFQVFFATGRSIREGVASWAVKISVYPSRLDPSLVNKSPKITCERAAEACDLGNPRLSCQNRATLFLKFFSFCKNKILSKNT